VRIDGSMAGRICAGRRWSSSSAATLPAATGAELVVAVHFLDGTSIEKRAERRA
jgi:hypothetical protein